MLKMLKWFGKGICIFLFSMSFLVGFRCIVLAEEKPQPERVLQLDEVNVVASPIIEENQVTRYGSQVTVISTEQISDLNAQDLPSALRRTPSVIISRHNPIGSFGGGTGGTIFIRAQGSSRPGAEIQTLIDGIPKFSGVWTHPLMDSLSIDPVESIEVYKGAQPVLYGNMAFGAVNLVTKRKRKPGFSTSLQGSGGSYNTWVEVTEHGGKIDAFDYYLIQSYRKSDGHRDNADGEVKDYFGRMGYELSPAWDVSLTLNRTDNWALDPGPEGRPRDAQGKFSINDSMTVLALSNHYERADGYFRLYWDKGDMDWEDQPDTKKPNRELFDTLTDYTNYGFRTRQIITPWEAGEIMAGFDLDFFGGRVTEVRPSGNKRMDRETFRLAAPYLAISHQFGPKESWHLTPSAGVRYLDHSQFDDQWGPQAGMILGYRETQLHASYARGINYPGINVIAQSYLSWGRNTLWRNLDPEILDHFEVGLSHTFSPMIRADATAFQDNGRDRFRFVAPPPPPAHFENIETYKTRGVETTITLTPSPDLAFFAGGTYLDGDPYDLPNVLKWSGSAGATVRFLKHFQLSLDTLYLDEHYVTNPRFPGARDKVGSAALLNGKLSYNFTIQPVKKFDGQIYLAGENLLDREYEYKKDYPMPGINGMAGLTVKF
ncbi:MAG: TonB-dependent receptor plug domain-containing protein [bacterium]